MKDWDERENEIAGEVPDGPAIPPTYGPDSKYYCCERCGYIYALKSGRRKQEAGS